MEDMDKRREIIKSMGEIQLFPEEAREIDIVKSKAVIPIDNLASLGTAFVPLKQMVQNFIHVPGGNGLYRVTVPSGAHLAKARDGRGFIGSALDNATNQVGAGQARLNPVMCDPTMLFMAAALSGIEKKLDVIKESSQDILEFLEIKEESKLQGNIIFLDEIIKNYKYNWDNDKYIESRRNQVLSILRESEASLLTFQKKIVKELEKNEFLYLGSTLKEKFQRVKRQFIDYQQALYMFGYSYYIDTLLLENFDGEYLESVLNKIKDYNFRYRDLFTKTYYALEGDLKKDVDALATKGIAKVSELIGKAVTKVPLLNQTGADKFFEGAGNDLTAFAEKQLKEMMDVFIDKQNYNMQPFIEGINQIGELYNNPINIAFDKSNIYLL